MLCVECGHINGPFCALCEMCGAQMPDIDKDPPFLTGTFRELFDAAEKVKNLQMKPEGFKKILETHNASLKKTMADIESMSASKEEMTDAEKKEMEKGKKGILLFIQATEIMGKFLNNWDENILEQGIAKALQGNTLLNEALALNWENFVQTKREIEEKLRQNSR